MKKQQHITAFYLETLLLIGVFITIILVLSQVFGIGRKMSREAGLLTNAVTLADNAAEAFTGRASKEELIGILNENGNTSQTEQEILVSYAEDMKPDPDGVYLVAITWVPDEEDPAFIRSTITVYHEAQTEPVYTLDTAVYHMGAPMVEPNEGVGE